MHIPRECLPHPPYCATPRLSVHSQGRVSRVTVWLLHNTAIPRRILPQEAVSPLSLPPQPPFRCFGRTLLLSPDALGVFFLQLSAHSPGPVVGDPPGPPRSQLEALGTAAQVVTCTMLTMLTMTVLLVTLQPCLGGARSRGRTRSRHSRALAALIPGLSSSLFISVTASGLSPVLL